MSPPGYQPQTKKRREAEGRAPTDRVRATGRAAFRFGLAIAPLFPLQWTCRFLFGSNECGCLRDSKRLFHQPPGCKDCKNLSGEAADGAEAMLGLVEDVAAGTDLPAALQAPVAQLGLQR